MKSHIVQIKQTPKKLRKVPQIIERKCVKKGTQVSQIICTFITFPKNMRNGEVNLIEKRLSLLKQIKSIHIPMIIISKEINK